MHHKASFFHSFIAMDGLVSALFLAWATALFLGFLYINMFKWLGKHPPGILCFQPKLSKSVLSGPFQFPMMGSTISLLRTGKNMFLEPHAAMAKLSLQYGRIMSVGLGDETWIVLSGFDEIKEFSMKSEAVSRPHMPALNELYAYNERLGTKSSGKSSS